MAHMIMMLATSPLLHNGTIYQGVCGHTSMQQGSFVLQNLAHWHNEVRTGMESPLSAPTRQMLSREMSPAAQSLEVHIRL